MRSERRSPGVGFVLDATLGSRLCTQPLRRRRAGERPPLGRSSPSTRMSPTWAASFERTRQAARLLRRAGVGPGSGRRRSTTSAPTEAELRAARGHGRARRHSPRRCRGRGSARRTLRRSAGVAGARRGACRPGQKLWKGQPVSDLLGYSNVAWRVPTWRSPLEASSPPTIPASGWRCSAVTATASARRQASTTSEVVG